MPSSIPTILHVTAPALYGGLERVVAGLATGFARRGHATHVLAILDERVTANPLVEALRGGGVGVTAVEVPHRRYRLERSRLREVAAIVGAGIVHTHGARVDVVDGPEARRLGLATVTTMHGLTGGGPRNRFYEWMQRRANRSCDAVVAVSRGLADRLYRSGIARGRLHLIPNAWVPGPSPLARVAARRALTLPEGGRRIGWVGRLTREKGADVFLKALACVPDPTVAASIIGDGPERARLESLGQRLGLGSRLTWHQVVPDAGRLLAAFDVLVLSSRTEGTPIVLFEAIAAGVPVVATSVGGVPDVVTEQEALLVPAEAPAALGDAMSRALSDVEGMISRSRAARARVAERFDAAAWLDAYEAVYRRVVH